MYFHIKNPFHMRIALAAACILLPSAWAAQAVDSDEGANAMNEIELPASFFPILPWGPLHGWGKPAVEPRHGVESMAECNFTIAGFVKASDLDACEELGLKGIVFPETENAGTYTREWSKLSEEEIDARVKKMADSAGDHPAVLGYYIMDEPGAGDFPALAKAVAAVRKYAPGKLAYINLFPGYATIGAPDTSQLETGTYTEYLERYVQQVRPQFISYDNYMVQYSMDLTQPEPAARYFLDLVEVRRVAVENGLPFWNIVSSNQIRPHTTIPSPANMMLQAYTTLAAGGRGVSWYTYYSGNYGYAPIDRSGDKSMTWHYLKMVNHQVRVLGPIMNRLKSRGVYFTSPPPAQGLPVLPGKAIQAIHSDVPMMVGEFQRVDGAHYAMVVNLSLAESAHFTIESSLDTGGAQVISAQDGRLKAYDGEAGYWLVAGQGVLLKLT